jgi:hypothetical protein
MQKKKHSSDFMLKMKAKGTKYNEVPPQVIWHSFARAQYALPS